MHCITALVVAALAMPSPVAGQLATTANVTVASLSFSGNGCPQGSATNATFVSNAGNSTAQLLLHVDPDAFRLNIGPGTTISDRTKNCQVHLNLRYPPDYQFAVTRGFSRGYAQLDGGVTASFFNTYYFSQDAATTTTTETVLSGGGCYAEPHTVRPWTKSAGVPAADRVYSPCGANGILNANFRVALTSTSSNSSGLLGLADPAGGGWNVGLDLAWGTCTD